MSFSEYIIILILSIFFFYIFIKNIIGSKIVVAKYLRSKLSSSSISLFDSGPQYKIHIWQIEFENGKKKNLEYGFIGFKGLKKILLYNSKKNKLISIFKVIIFLLLYILTLFYLIEKIYLLIISILLSFIILLIIVKNNKQ